MPFGFQIAPDTLPSGTRATGSRSALAVSGFRLRARLGFSIPPCFPGQRGITPAFGYGAPHPSAEGTSTPLTHALPSTHYWPIQLSSWLWCSRLAVCAACASPLASKSWLPQFRATACVRLPPPIRRSPPARSSGSRRTDPRDVDRLWFWRRVWLSTRLRGFASARLPDTHLPQIFPGTFDPTFTTTAFDRSSSDWFETCS